MLGGGSHLIDATRTPGFLSEAVYIVTIVIPNAIGLIAGSCHDNVKS